MCATNIDSEASTEGSQKPDIKRIKKAKSAPNPILEEELLDAMKAGKKMTVVGFSTRGTETTDIYSLIGFTKSINNLIESC